MKTKVINISLPERLLNEADRAAKKEARNRSDFFREAVRNYLADRKRLDALYEYGEQKAKELGIKQEDINDLIADVRAGR